MKFRTDSLGAFAHAGQAPVPLAARLQQLRIDAASVVADQDSQLAGGVFELISMLFARGMPECVDQSFAADAINLVAQDWV